MGSALAQPRSYIYKKHGRLALTWHNPARRHAHWAWLCNQAEWYAPLTDVGPLEADSILSFLQLRKLVRHGLLVTLVQSHAVMRDLEFGDMSPQRVLPPRQCTYLRTMNDTPV